MRSLRHWKIRRWRRFSIPCAALLGLLTQDSAAFAQLQSKEPRDFPPPEAAPPLTAPPLTAPPPVAHFNLLLIGDSITKGQKTDPGFRDDLFRLLASEPLYTFTFLGSCGEPPLCGHFRGGLQIQDLYPNSSGNPRRVFHVDSDLGPPATPDIAAIHMGTNDLHSQAPPFVPYSLDHGITLCPSQSAELAELICYLLQWQNGSRSDRLQRIVLSTIIPMRGRDLDVSEWNEAEIAMVEDFAEGTATGVPVRVTLADNYRRFIANPRLFSAGPGGWMLDAMHPNRKGQAQMAKVYHAAIMAAIEDRTPPAAAAFLEVVTIGSTSVTLLFRASGDDGFLGRATRYDLRYSNAVFGPDRFGMATQARGEHKPGAPAVSDTLRVTGLLPGTTYHFALKVVDDAGNRSPMSNLATASTPAQVNIVAALRRR